MENEKTVLEFRGVGVPALPPLFGEMREVDLVLRAGDLLCVSAGTGADGVLPLGDLAVGIRKPEQGEVLVQGQAWTSISPTDAAALRGVMGRVFDQRGWLSNLDMDENITLIQRHFTQRSLKDIEAEALEWAVRFGLSELPRMRPAVMNKSALRRAEWVRAFLGQPLLIILEHPLLDVYAEHAQALLEAVAWARERGTAVMWMDEEAGVWRSAGNLAPTRVYRREGFRLTPEKEV